MIFEQNPKDGSGIIKFSWRERILLFTKGRIIMDPVSFRHFSNNLIKIVAEWTVRFDKKTQKLATKKDDIIKTK